MSNYKSNLQTNNQALSANNTDLQSLIEQANNLPDAGVELPTLTNGGTAADLLSGKQLIDQEGNIITGTIKSQVAKTITPTESSQTAVTSGVYTTGAITVGAIPDGYMVGSEISAQDNLIAQIQTALQGKASGGNGGEVASSWIDLSTLPYTEISIYGVEFDGYYVHTLTTTNNISAILMSHSNIMACIYVRRNDEYFSFTPIDDGSIDWLADVLIESINDQTITINIYTTRKDSNYMYILPIYSV